MKPVNDGPVSPHFEPLPIRGNISLEALEGTGVSDTMIRVADYAVTGTCTSWGIPFDVGDPVLVTDTAVTIELPPTQAPWLAIMHTSDVRPMEPNKDGFIPSTRGPGALNEHAATYVLLYADGTEASVEIRRRHQIGPVNRRWGENCFQAVAHHKPQPVRASHEQPNADWGQSQTRADNADLSPWVNWLWAWQNPHPDKTITGLRVEPVAGALLIFGIAAGTVSEQPFRWQRRHKALLALPEGTAFDPTLNSDGLLAQIQLDMGQVISVTPRLCYPNATWGETYNNQLPVPSLRELIVEYTAHPDACFHLALAPESALVPGEDPEEALVIPVAAVQLAEGELPLAPIAPATQRVILRVVEQGSDRPVAVKLHVHGQADESLVPVDRHRIINDAWFEDYSVDYKHNGLHACTYIPGETTIDLPLGIVHIEVSKGFEIKPVRRTVQVTGETETLTIEISRVLPWRDKGWVTADTHVHFLSPMSALLEGAGEGVNVVNLLASQWGELMTNVGDFDGAMTWGSKEAGGDGEYMVRVGTENRQHVLGHISLLGYRGRIIAPMTVGGADESALGDPIDVLLTEWARQCHRQGGLVVLPHFPNPRAENAAAIVSGDVDALEMTSWGDLYGGLNPYSLSDWYRYLNCGYLVAAVGGTDKMWSGVAVGAVRTYAHIEAGRPFSYEGWMDAVKRAETFVTYGPLLEFAVDGQPMGSRIEMDHSGGTVDIMWHVASVTVPMSRVELIVNGEIRESVAVDAWQGSGSWSVRVERSSWLALLVRGHYADQQEIIAAHSSPVMVTLEGSPMLAAADAVTILEQIEGALAYLDTIGTRAEDRVYKRARLVMESAHRGLHNRMHRLGYFHDHTPVTDHPEHH
jgi:hypothetical protein